MKPKLISFLLIILLSNGAMAETHAVIFDCDGVLVDSEYSKYQAWEAALQEQKINFTIDEYIPLVGYSSEHILNKILVGKTHNINSKSLIARKDQLYKEKQRHAVKPIIPAINFLNQLLDRKDELDVKVAIVSSASHDEIMHNLIQSNVKVSLLDAVYSGNDDLKHIQDPEGTNKPKPYIYQLAASGLQIVPEKILVFEDTNAGVTAAYLAQMNVIAVPNEYTKQHDFSAAKATISFNNFKISQIGDYMQVDHKSIS